MKAVYTIEQTQILIGYLDTMVISGIENCKRVALIAGIIEKPIQTIEEKEGGKNECSEHNTGTN
jgi:hypothetical protein